MQQQLLTSVKYQNTTHLLRCHKCQVTHHGKIRGRGSLLARATSPTKAVPGIDKHVTAPVCESVHVTAPVTLHTNAPPTAEHTCITHMSGKPALDQGGGPQPIRMFCPSLMHTSSRTNTPAADDQILTDCQGDELGCAISHLTLRP